MNIERKIRLFFIAYGRLLFVSIVIVLIFIFALKSINDIAKEKKEAELVTQNQITEEEKVEIQEQKKQTAEEKEYIKKFIDYCNTGKIEEAYGMLSEKCKKEKYTNLQDFKSQYLNKVFNIKINEYEIQKIDDTYKVTLTQDALLTGKTNSEIQSTYKIEEDLEGIYIIN